MRLYALDYRKLNYFLPMRCMGWHEFRILYRVAHMLPVWIISVVLNLAVCGRSCWHKQEAKPHKQARDAVTQWDANRCADPVQFGMHACYRRLSDPLAKSANQARNALICFSELCCTTPQSPLLRSSSSGLRFRRLVQLASIHDAAARTHEVSCLGVFWGERPIIMSLILPGT